MPVKSSAQKKLMEAAAHTKGGYGGVPQSVGKEFVGKDAMNPSDRFKVIISKKGQYLNAPTEYAITENDRPMRGRNFDTLEEANRVLAWLKKNARGDAAPTTKMEKIDAIVAHCDALTKRAESLFAKRRAKRSDAAPQRFIVTCIMKEHPAMRSLVPGQTEVMRTIGVAAATKEEAEAKAIGFYKKDGYRTIKVTGVDVRKDASYQAKGTENNGGKDISPAEAEDLAEAHIRRLGSGKGSTLRQNAKSFGYSKAAESAIMAAHEAIQNKHKKRKDSATCSVCGGAADRPKQRRVNNKIVEQCVAKFHDPEMKGNTWSEGDFHRSAVKKFRAAGAKRHDAGHRGYNSPANMRRANASFVGKSFEEGFKAAKAGKPASANPYPYVPGFSSDARQAWAKGHARGSEGRGDSDLDEQLKRRGLIADVRIGGRTYRIKQTGPKEWRYEAGSMSMNGSGLDGAEVKAGLIARMKREFA